MYTIISMVINVTVYLLFTSPAVNSSFSKPSWKMERQLRLKDPLKVSCVHVSPFKPLVIFQTASTLGLISVALLFAVYVPTRTLF